MPMIRDAIMAECEWESIAKSQMNTFFADNEEERRKEMQRLDQFQTKT